VLLVTKGGIKKRHHYCDTSRVGKQAESQELKAKSQRISGVKS